MMTTMMIKKRISMRKKNRMNDFGSLSDENAMSSGCLCCFLIDLVVERENKRRKMMVVVVFAAVVVAVQGEKAGVAKEEDH